ncbi:MAG: pyridoxamine 5'-phosphate oxidase family protein [Candidatus Levyibacteriota bacterium]
MDVGKLVRDYLKEARMMQVATSKDNQPWVCTLYYASDDNQNIYWISKPDTRHSKELMANKKVAVAIPVKFNTLTVVGLQVEGEAEEVSNLDEIKKYVKLYSDKFKRGEGWYQDFLLGKNEHKLYRINPKMFVLFDAVNFPDNPRQEIRV